LLPSTYIPIIIIITIWKQVYRLPFFRFKPSSTKPLDVRFSQRSLWLRLTPCSPVDVLLRTSRWLTLWPWAWRQYISPERR
jgi:hypothetical protein